MQTYTLHRGNAPLLISVPHDGTVLPEALVPRLLESARRVPDTDWHIARLYAVAKDLGASLLVPIHSRYVVDLNRSEDDVSLYPGQNTTGLCPHLQFSGEPVYIDGLAPGAAEVGERVETWWRPYHQALRAELDRLRGEHGRVLLWEGHSIRGEVPFLFDGRLPDLNLGTAGGTSCSPAMQSALEAVLAGQAHYDWISNGRFKGGYITRHYGDPVRGIEAVQLETSQRTYMDENSFAWREAEATRLQALLRTLLQAAIGLMRA